MSDVPAERVAKATEWLEFAKGDLYVAQLILRDPEALPSLAAFHAQQAGEKALKALLVLHGIDFPRTHDLVALFNLLPDGCELDITYLQLEELTT